MSVEEMETYLGLDSLRYLSLEGLLSSTGIENPRKKFCKACFDGCYPVQFDDDLSKDCMEIRHHD
jgi:amidophosphoribosyltransferase